MTKSKDMFDKWSLSYDHYLDTSPFYQDLVSKLVSGADLKAGMDILDVGVGTGLISEKVLQKCNCSITGIDVSPRMLLKARSNLEKQRRNVSLQKMDVQKLSFGKDRFDAVFAAFALHHVPDDRKIGCLRKIHNALRKSGTLHIAEVVIDTEGDEDNVERLKHILERWGYAALLAMRHGGTQNVVVELEAIRNIYLRNGEYLVPAKRWKDYLADAGFKKIEAREVNSRLGHFVLRGTRAS